MALLIDLQGCVSCGLCADVCPGDIIYMDGDYPTVPYVDECWYCGICRDACPTDVISFELPAAYVDQSRDTFRKVAVPMADRLASGGG